MTDTFVSPHRDIGEGGGHRDQRRALVPVDEALALRDAADEDGGLGCDVLRLATIDDAEMRAPVVDAWAMVLPKGVAAAYLPFADVEHAPGR